MIRFIHFADVRLDAPLSITDSKKAALRRQEMKASFSKMLSDAAASSASFVLITGGLFDRSNVSKQTAEYLCTEFSRYPDIRFIITPGRYDYYTSDSIYNTVAFPENVCVFTSEDMSALSFDVGEDKVTVHGCARTALSDSSSAVEKYKVSSSDAINVLMCDLLVTSRKGGELTPDKLAATGADYCALAHPDASVGVYDEGDMWYSYPGTPEVLGFEGSNDGGYVYVEAQKIAGDFTCKAKIRKASAKKYITETVSVSGAMSGADAVNAVNAYLQSVAGLDSDTVLRLVIKGNVSPDVRDFTQDIKELDILKDVFITYVIDETVPLYNHEYLSEDPTIKGAYYNALRAAICSDDKEISTNATDALRLGLDALDGKNRISQKR